MIIIKTPAEIKLLREGGIILARTLQAVAALAKPGVTIRDLNTHAEQYVRDQGAICAFKGYRPSHSDTAFPTGLCVSINEQVVHGLGNIDRVLQDGDLLSIDLGVKFKGLFTDAAITVGVGTLKKQDQKLLDVTKEALARGVAEVAPGKYVHDISHAVQEYVEAHGFSVVRELVGHGVGKKIHEDPAIPNFKTKQFPIVKLKEGMVLAIEPMVTAGDYLVETLDDDWTVSTRDKKNAAHFEHSVAVVPGGYEILTTV